MKYIIGKKVGMVQVFDVNGKVLPATVVTCEPNKVISVKPNNTIVVGYKEVEEKKLNKPQLGFFKKLGSKPYQVVSEFKDVNPEIKAGDEIKVDSFNKGEYIDVQGYTKGRGYTGAIVRWNYKIGPLSHGAGYAHRYQGSIAFGRGGSQGQRVPKGKKMAGQYGHEIITTCNLVVVDVLPKYNAMLILGSIPGPQGCDVLIKSSQKKADKNMTYTIINKEIQEDILKSNEQLENKEALHSANVAADAANKK